MQVSGQLYAPAPYSWVKNPWYSFDRKLSRSHSWFGYGDKEKIPVPVGIHLPDYN
jgi:hypothetical protein